MLNAQLPAAVAPLLHYSTPLLHYSTTPLLHYSTTSLQVLLFEKAHHRRITPEAKRLVAFRRIRLGGGASVAVSFLLPATIFSFVGLQAKR